MFSQQPQIEENGLSFIERSWNTDQSSWFVFYTCPRAEKVVYNELTKRDFEVFLPTTKTLRIWKNRQRKWIDQILFPGYIFVNTQQYCLYDIKKVPKVVTYIHCAGKPSIVPLKDIEGIRKMLNLDQEISVETEFYEGEKVRIIFGPLVGHEGILTKYKGKARFGIELKEINHTIFVEIGTNVLEKI